VVLSGDGGDEAFGGYEKYWNFLSYVRWHRRIRSVLPVGLVSKIASKYHMLMPGYGRISRLQWNAHGAYAASMSTFDPKELAWLRPEVGPGFYPTIAGERARRDREVGLRGMQILDLEGCLPEQILVKLDRATMHHGVEARCPLLDHRIVEYALRLPPPVSPKAPLVGYCRSTAARHALARPKMGFSMPLSTWLLGDLRHLVDDMMHDDGFLEIVRVDGRALRSLVHAHRLGIRKLGRKVWTVLLLWAWRQAIRPYEKFSA
jgi:asparagine synthase (glutamine-hydrolysing)